MKNATLYLWNDINGHFWFSTKDENKHYLSSDEYVYSECIFELPENVTYGSDQTGCNQFWVNNSYCIIDTVDIGNKEYRPKIYGDGFQAVLKLVSEKIR